MTLPIGLVFGFMSVPLPKVGAKHVTITFSEAGCTKDQTVRSPMSRISPVKMPLAPVSTFSRPEWGEASSSSTEEVLVY